MGNKRTGEEVVETVLQCGISGAERDTGEQVDGGRKENFWDWRWGPAGGEYVQVAS